MVIFFYCWDVQCAVTPFLLDSITCLQATHQGKMESFLLYLYFPFIGFLLNQMMAKLDWFYMPLIFLFIFSASLSFLLYYQKAVSALFSVHFIAFKNFGNSFSCPLTCSSWKIPWTFCLSPLFWWWSEWWLPLLSYIHSTILFPTLSSRNLRTYLVYWCPICSHHFLDIYTSLYLFKLPF